MSNLLLPGTPISGLISGGAVQATDLLVCARLVSPGIYTNVSLVSSQFVVQNSSPTFENVYIDSDIFLYDADENGGIVFTDAYTLTTHAAKLSWDNVNGYFAIGGSAVPTNTLTVQGSSYLNGNNTLLGTTTAISSSTIQFASITNGLILSGLTGLLSAGNLSGDITSSSFSTTISANAVSNSKFRQSAALSIVGNSTNTTANVADITATGGSQVLITNSAGTTLGFSTLSSSAVTSVAGTTNQVNVSASVGAVTLSLPQSIDTSATVNFGTVMASNSSTACFVGTSNNSSTSPVSSSNQNNVALINTNSTNNTWVQLVFVGNNGNVASFIGCQFTNQSMGTSNISLYTNNGSGPVQTMLLTGAGVLTLNKYSTGVLTSNSSGVISSSSALSSSLGGTGVSNGSGSTITLGGAITMSGAFTFTGTLSANTSVTFPTSGTLLSTATVVTPAQGGTGTSTVFTAGSIIFSGSSGIYTQNNANFYWNNSNNYLGIGPGAIYCDSYLTINGNSTASPATSGYSVYAHIIGAAATSPAIMLDSFGGGSGMFVSRVAAGTAASPTAITGNSPLLTITANGYNGSAYSAGGYMQYYTSETWTSAHQGTSFFLYTTLTGTLTSVTSFSVINGNLTLQDSISRQLSLNNSTSSTATTGSFTVPALAAGFIPITLNGTTQKIPYYGS